MNTWIGMAALAAAVTGGVVARPDGPVGTVGERAWVVAQDTTGKALFTGKGNCATCHGVDGKGTVLAPDLTDGEWLHSDGSMAGIAKTIKEGVATPKKFPAPMPAMGGAQLTEAELQAVAHYVHSLQPAPKGE